MKDKIITQLLDKLSLPNQFANYIPLYFEPLVKTLHQQAINYKTPIIGINGSQGSGKTTASIVLKTLFEEEYEQQVIILSIDDFYHSLEKRQELAKSLHPLFITRGVPGTHDVSLALKTLGLLQQIKADESVLVPRFDKILDDRKPRHQWDKVIGPVSLIIFEGWCVGSSPIDPKKLIQPINKLEKLEDFGAIWRTTSNEFLLKEYQILFEQINYLVMLKAPSFDVVYEWRLLQEQKLQAQKRTKFEATNLKKTSLLNKAQLKRFIQHYQRLTEHNLLSIPAIADAVISLDEQHQMTELCFNLEKSNQDN